MYLQMRDEMVVGKGGKFLAFESASSFRVVISLRQPFGGDNFIDYRSIPSASSYILHGAIYANWSPLFFLT
jgi:hypothetical protein